MIHGAKFFALLFFTSNILGVDFDENTFVLTPNGCVPINQIKLCDPMINDDVENNVLAMLMNIGNDAITDISKEKILSHNVFPIIASITVSWGVGDAVEASLALFNVRMWM